MRHVPVVFFQKAQTNRNKNEGLPVTKKLVDFYKLTFF